MGNVNLPSQNERGNTEMVLIYITIEVNQDPFRTLKVIKIYRHEERKILASETK